MSVLSWIYSELGQILPNTFGRRTRDLLVHERKAIAVILSGSDVRLTKLRMQWDCAVSFERRNISGCRVTIPLHDQQYLAHRLFRNTLESEAVIVDDDQGQWWECSLGVGCGGGTRLFSKQARNGLANATKFDKGIGHAITLPNIAPQKVLLEAFRAAFPQVMLASSEYGNIEMLPPASDQEIRRFEEVASVTFPDTYKKYLSVADGMLLGETTVFRHNDGFEMAQKMGMPHKSYIVIADDIINGICSGFYCISLVGNVNAVAEHVDQYGNVDQKLSFVEMMNVLMLRAIDCDMSIKRMEERCKNKQRIPY